MKPEEIRPLVMAARKAFDYQKSLGLEDGQTFDQWRRREVMAVVGKSGLTACSHGDFQPLLAHFQTLAGDDGAAFASAMKTGKPTDHAAPGDTWEERRQLAHAIAGLLDDHISLASKSVEELIQEGAAQWATACPGIPFPGAHPDWIRGVRKRKAAIESHGRPLSVGYIVHLVRQKTRRPDLTLGQDWRAGLAERCTVRQLTQIRATLQNRINAVEGLGSADTRNKSQKSDKARQARAEKGDARRW